MMETAARSIVTQGPRILLCHRPYFLKQAADQGIDLVLSGHTHGGQVVFGRFGDLTLTPARLASPYVWGPYSLGAAQMFVSRGIGTVGLPMRINCPPEIALIILKRT
jgi:predicted MPP superfamily phosphohydrolase